MKTLPKDSPTLHKNGHQHLLISHRERDDAYKGIVIKFCSRWRLIVCKDQIQWILQKRENYHGGNWKGQRYVTSKIGLLVACGELKLLSNPRVKEFVECYSHFGQDTRSNKLLNDMDLHAECPERPEPFHYSIEAYDEL